MSLLLNPRAWAALILSFAALSAGMFVYRKGAESVQVTFDVYKNQQVLDTLSTERAARAKEQSLQVANRKVSANYETLKTATAVAVGALDADRMRLQDAITASDPGANPAARSCADDAARLRHVFGQCANALQTMARIADNQENQLVGLQDYVRNVVPK